MTVTGYNAKQKIIENYRNVNKHIILIHVHVVLQQELRITQHIVFLILFSVFNRAHWTKSILNLER